MACVNSNHFSTATEKMQCPQTLWLYKSLCQLVKKWFAFWTICTQRSSMDLVFFSFDSTALGPSCMSYCYDFLCFFSFLLLSFHYTTQTQQTHILTDHFSLHYSELKKHTVVMKSICILALWKWSLWPCMSNLHCFRCDLKFFTKFGKQRMHSGHGLNA